MADPTLPSNPNLVARMCELWKRIDPTECDDDPVAMTMASAVLAEAAARLEELECEHAALLRGRVPTHRCKVCGALWTLWAAQPEKYPAGHPLHQGSWSLFSRSCGKCCDNVAMGEQIEPIQLAAPIERSTVETAPVPAGMDTPWPLRDVLAKLIEATEHLLRDHGCDVHGHEGFRSAVEWGTRLLEQRPAVETSGGTDG